jgi:hypothetical protein
MKKILSIAAIFIIVFSTFSMLAVMSPTTAAQGEPAPILELTIPDTARVVDFDYGIYVVGTSSGSLYVVNEAGEYTSTPLSSWRIRDVRIEDGFIAVASEYEVIMLSLPLGSLTPTELWRRTPGGGYVASVDLSSDGAYVAYLACSHSVGVYANDGTLVASYSIAGSWIACWLDATDDMEYIAITAEVGPPEADYGGVNTGVELYRFDHATGTLTKQWGRILIYNYETTEVRVSEAKDYVAVATSSGTFMNLLNLSTGEVLWQYETPGKEQFACDGDDNLNYVIGGTQAWSPPYPWFVLKNLGATYAVLAEGSMAGPINDLDSNDDSSLLAFGSDAGEFILLERNSDDTIETILTGNVGKLIDSIEVGSNTLLVGGQNFINLYEVRAPAFNIAVVFTKFAGDDPAPSRPMTDFENIKNDMISYYSEVSYGSVSFDIKFYPNDGSWLELPQNRKYYGKNDEQFVKNATEVSDSIIDFTGYDYDSENGRGVVMLIHAGYSRQQSGSADDMSTQVKYGDFFSASGGYDTDDATKVDAIIVAEMENVGSWAHEVGHVLGKLLVTSVTGTGKDGAWYLPDRYKGGYFAGNGEIDYWGLMGRGCWLPLDWLGRGTDGTHPDHMCSFSKEWLGWLKYREYQHPSYGTYWINSLVTMKYGDDVFKYKINDNMYYILEVRNKNSKYSKWDTTAPIQRPAWPVLTYDSAEVIYKVEKKNDMWIVNVESHIVLFPLQDYHSDDANEVMFKVVDENWGTKYEMKTEIKKPTIWNKIGAILDPGARLISLIAQAIGPSTPFQFEYPLPDLDLHAYTDDGKHVGMNYVTEEYEIQIPEATTSGDLWNGQEWIFVPDDINVHFVVSSRDNAEFLNAFPEAMSFTDGIDTYDFFMTYYDSSGIRYESSQLSQQIPAGNALAHPYSIVQNPDATYSITVGEGLSLTTVQTWITDSDFNDITSFRAVFTPDGKTGYYKLTATNPGQFYQNILVNNTGPIPLNITITYDIDANFTLKGAVPIHVYADLYRTTDITSTCTFQDNKIIAYNVPPGGIVYVTIHLDYVLKRTKWIKSQVDGWYSEHAFNAAAETAISSIKSSVTITDPETKIPAISAYLVFLMTIVPSTIMGFGLLILIKYAPLTKRRRKED